MKERQYQICTKTIMDTSDPTIVFNDGSFLVEPTDVELENKLKSLKYL